MAGTSNSADEGWLLFLQHARGWNKLPMPAGSDPHITPAPGMPQKGGFTGDWAGDEGSGIFYLGWETRKWLSMPPFCSNFLARLSTLEVLFYNSSSHVFLLFFLYACMLQLGSV